MALFIGSADIIPRSIRAKSAVSLERKIRDLQLKKGMEYKFISFYFDGEYHVGWYYIHLTETEVLTELMEKQNERTKE